MALRSKTNNSIRTKARLASLDVGCQTDITMADICSLEDELKEAKKRINKLTFTKGSFTAWTMTERCRSSQDFQTF